MQKVIHKIQLLKNRLRLEDIYNIMMIFIILIILGLSIFASFRSINPIQLNSIYQISQQSNYADTQEMALLLLNQEKINVGQYLKLMLALQMEQKRAKQLPAISIESHS
ncbi:hypothetical protein B9T31_02435 [Acinetobacter sp. ANC 4558]|uniref:hypothetical protein n=1 Tax=Acinetobacter sp. ANC 4558 TaxID=1977876 RepID=UPI000A35AD70|nr:hypothetical protein [Acinetobacter sp. ANC 4558]OTG88388.1 hypothetical protein B9T31_02435 [Acinetobacter sp. ANC 4558]